MTNKKIISFILVLVLSLSLCLYLLKLPPKKPRLKVLAYSSFSGVYGPGRKIQAQFETFCECEVQWFFSEDSTALLQRFLLISHIDLVIGWDQITLPLAENTLWEDLSFLKEELVKKKLSFEQEDFFKTPYFLPFAWSPIGFIYRDPMDIHPLKGTLKSLFYVKGQISFPEPRSSSLGLQFYYWIYEIFKGDKELITHFLTSLKKKIYGPVFSWSLAYGFFQKGKTEMGLSYLSSLIYHHKEEKTKPYFFATFKEGHPYQVEFISISNKGKNKDLAKSFAKFLLSKNIQENIRETHYMFPLAKNLSSHPLLKTHTIHLISYSQLKDFINQKEELLNVWEDILY